LFLVFVCVGGGDFTCADDLIPSACVKWGGCDAHTLQIETQKGYRQVQRIKLEMEYFDLTKKSPEYKNLINSIAIDDSDANSFSEIATALELISFLDKTDKELVHNIVSCYERNTSPVIRLICIKALSRHDEKKSDQYARQFIADPDSILDVKLLITENLLERGKLFGYPVLQEGLASNKEHLRQLSERILNIFKEYDGKTYDESNRIIDIRSMRELLNKNNLTKSNNQ
jgi:hypothetical protein